MTLAKIYKYCNEINCNFEDDGKIGERFESDGPMKDPLGTLLGAANFYILPSMHLTFQLECSSCLDE